MPNSVSSPLAMPDLLPGEGFDSVSSLDSAIEPHNKIAHVQYASQANQLSFLDASTQHLSSPRPFSHPSDYAHLSLVEPNGHFSSYGHQRLSQYPSLAPADRPTLSSFESLGSPSPVSSFSSDSASTSSSSPPTSSNFHPELSELRFSLSKLALHAEGAPIIVCEDGAPRRNSSTSSGANGSTNGRPHSRRKSYRMLHSFPGPAGSAAAFMYPEVDSFSCFSATSLSTAYHRYQQNVAYFYQKNPALYQTCLGSPAEVSHQSQLLMHHHHFHHVHYHHHLHSKQQQNQLKDWVDTCEELASPMCRSSIHPSLVEGEEAFPGGPPYAQQQQQQQHLEQSRVRLLKGDDLVFHPAIQHLPIEPTRHHFRPIGSEALEARKAAALLARHSPTESTGRLKGPVSSQLLFGDLLDETSSLDSSLEDSPYSLYSPISSSSSSSSSSEPNAAPLRDFYCDVRPELSHGPSRAISTPVKSSPMCSLALSSSPDESYSSSLPSSPSSFTSNSSLVFSSEYQQHRGESVHSLLPPPNGNPQTEYAVDKSSFQQHLKLPRQIKARKRRKKDKPITVVRRMVLPGLGNNFSESLSAVTDRSSIDYYGALLFDESVAPSSVELPNSTPPQRPWIPLAKPSESSISNVFTVMCYNVLCDKYATRQLYGYCPNWALSWDYRRNAIMQEIKNFDADIISLQEVETEQFYNYFQPQLATYGYEGIFSPKSRAKTMTEHERRHVDGCAIFFKTEKFSLVKEHLIEFNQLAMANAEGSDDMLNRVMTKDNISLVALLQTKDSENSDNLSEPSIAAGQPLVVCTAHIHWDPEYCDVKLIQTMMLMHELRTFVDEASTQFRLNSGGNKADSNSIPLIMCCDLNSLPGSGVVDYLSNGRIAVEHPDFKDIPYKESLQKLSPIVSDSSKSNSNEYTHAFELIKAYKDNVMPFTNYTYDFKGVIDYIFCSKITMRVLGVLGPLDTNWLRENKIAGCPHQYIPSDHFPLVVELEMTPKILSPGMVSSNSGSSASSGAANGHLIRR